jgi:hypothetical protein
MMVTVTKVRIVALYDQGEISRVQPEDFFSCMTKLLSPFLFLALHQPKLSNEIIEIEISVDTSTIGLFCLSRFVAELVLVA